MDKNLKLSMLVFDIFSIPLFLFWMLTESLLKRQALQSTPFLFLKQGELSEVCDYWPYLFSFELLPGKKDSSSSL